MSTFLEFRGPSAPDRAFVFPGQGSQVVGMGKDLYEQYASARALYDQADEILGFSLSSLCFEGPEDELTQTRNAQPAIAVTSLALLKVATEVTPALLARPAFMAGHSLGEYSALIASGALAFDEGVRLLHTRGQLMQSAGEQMPGTMAAIIGLDTETCAQVCQATGVEISTDNAPGQIVIGGTLEAIPRAIDEARARGATGAIPLSVSGAFHSSLMRSAAEGLAPGVGAAAILESTVPIVANCSAAPIADPDSIRKELIDQVTSTVQWTKTVEFLGAQGIQTIIEFGPGHVLTSIVKRMLRTAQRVNVSDSTTLSVSV